MDQYNVHFFYMDDLNIGTNFKRIMFEIFSLVDRFLISAFNYYITSVFFYNTPWE